MADNPILAILSKDSDSDEPKADEKNAKKKRRAAEDLIESIKDEDADGIVDAIEAILNLLDLDG